MNFLNRCNGYKAQPNFKFSTDGLSVMNSVIDMCRFELLDQKLPEGWCNGHRFGDNQSVIDRIVSAATSEFEVMTDTRAWAMDALRDCAGADHWYTYEKEW